MRYEVAFANGGTPHNTVIEADNAETAILRAGANFGRGQFGLDNLTFTAVRSEADFAAELPEDADSDKTFTEDDHGNWTEVKSPGKLPDDIPEIMSGLPTGYRAPWR
jgi:hypothetical protein